MPLLAPVGRATVLRSRRALAAEPIDDREILVEVRRRTRRPPATFTLVSWAPSAARLVRKRDTGSLFNLGLSEVRLILTGEDTNGAFALSEQPLVPRALAGPLHRHANEDGFIHVVRGCIGAQVNGTVVRAEEGSTVLVPRGMTHTFWNDADEPARVLEMFTPAGLEAWFKELAEIVTSGSFTLDEIVSSGRRYGTELDMDSLQPLLDNHGLVLPGL